VGFAAAWLFCVTQQSHSLACLLSWKGFEREYEGRKREAPGKDGDRARRRGREGPGPGRITARGSNPSAAFRMPLLYRATRPPATHRRPAHLVYQGVAATEPGSRACDGRSENKTQAACPPKRAAQKLIIRHNNNYSQANRKISLRE